MFILLPTEEITYGGLPMQTCKLKIKTFGFILGLEFIFEQAQHKSKT
jgi:hypothetical protein